MGRILTNSKLHSLVTTASPRNREVEATKCVWLADSVRKETDGGPLLQGSKTCCMKIKVSPFLILFGDFSFGKTFSSF